MRFRYALFFLIALVPACQMESGPKPGIEHGADELRAGSNTPYNANISSNSSHGNMTHEQALPSNAPFDLQFIDSMIRHHSSALQMGQAAEGLVRDPELKKLISKMMSEQKGEINEMNRLREAWYPGSPSAVNFELPGMHLEKHMGGHPMEMPAEGDGDPAGVKFVEMMIPHHQGAIDLSNHALSNTSRPELIELARGIVNQQRAEIEKLRSIQERLSRR